MSRFTFLRIRAGHERCIPCANAVSHFLCPLGMRRRVAVEYPPARQLPFHHHPFTFNSDGRVIWLEALLGAEYRLFGHLLDSFGKIVIFWARRPS